MTLNSVPGAPDAALLAHLQHATCHDPFAVLGWHSGEGHWAYRALLPGAVQVTWVGAHGLGELALNQVPGSDLWCTSGTLVHGVATGQPGVPDYRLRVCWQGREAEPPQTLDDPYRFTSQLREADLWLLGEGTHLRPYEALGAHPLDVGGVGGVRFAVWAPQAQRVSVVGDFNAWDGRRHMMRWHPACGVWDIFIPHVAEGDRYRFEVLGADGVVRLKADPYANRAELRPGTASIVQRLPAGVASSPERQRANALDAPISIYEVHLGSWQRGPQGRWLSYTELADTLVPYAVELGFTHLELLPVGEHPFDGSWGYQPIGLYAPTARFGTPEDFKHFVEVAHAAGLGVILDWVPAHFPCDDHGLAQFDGTHLYEHADPREGFHPDWNTLIYNYGRTEVRNFLVGNALYWIERFGIDGLRVDAVASMLYRDYSRAPGEWVPNRLGGRENLEAIEFLRRMNRVIGQERPEAVMIAEESTSFVGVSRPVSPDGHSGGLGFHYKWNMGWMNDTLRYMARDPVHRRYHQDEMRFALMYAFNENFVLPLSHDEVVHGKGSMLRKMPDDPNGGHWRNFANLRAFYGWLWGHPGKKLLFMGNEFGQWEEWNADAELQWHWLQQPQHAGLQRLVRDLNRVLRHHPALYRQDFSPQGFAWIRHDDCDNSVLAFERLSGQPEASGAERVVVISHFTPEVRFAYRLGVPQAGAWQVLIDTDDAAYGGAGVDLGPLVTEPVACDGHRQSLLLNLPPLATLMLAPQPPARRERAQPGVGATAPVQVTTPSEPLPR